MYYTSVLFWFGLIPAVLVLLVGDRVLRGKEAAKKSFHKIFMLVWSLTLFGLASWQSLVIFFVVSLIAYYACLTKERLLARGVIRPESSRRVARWMLLFLIPLLLLPLAYYKYGYFFGQAIFQAEWDTLRDLAIPLGISFYTFKLVSFSVDTLMNDDKVPNLLDYMNFCSFFPVLVSGPIERRKDLIPQVENMAIHPTSDQFILGVRYIVLGLFFKLVMANNLTSALWQGYVGGNAFVVWMNNLVLSFRIYFDFAGYAFMAYGLAYCMGITVRMNFASPYTATNIGEYWKRWHTSLTSWLRDYIYFPLGGSRTKRWALNMLMVFIVSGLWHGAGWNFVIWGLFLGCCLITVRFYKKNICDKAGFRLWGPVGWAITFTTAVFARLFFYEANMEHLWTNLVTLATPQAYDVGEFVRSIIIMKHAGALLLPFLTLSFLIIFLEFLAGRKKQDPYRFFVSPVACAMMVFLLVFLHTGTSNQFIYFAF